MPETWQWPLLLFMALAGGFGHFMLIQAHRLAPASLLAPFIYTQIVWMILIGFVTFGDVPDMWTLIGATIVIARSSPPCAARSSQRRRRTWGTL